MQSTMGHTGAFNLKIHHLPKSYNKKPRHVQHHNANPDHALNEKELREQNREFGRA